MSKWLSDQSLEGVRVVLGSVTLKDQRRSEVGDAQESESFKCQRRSVIRIVQVSECQNREVIIDAH